MTTPPLHAPWGAAFLALLVLAAGTASPAATAVKKKPAVAGRTHHAARRSRRRASAPRLDPARRAEMIEEISARLKDPAPHAIAFESALEGFYAQLALHEDERRNGGVETGTVRVMQWGDSHTAADMFTGETRRIFQQQFGNGGIGYSYAGHPFPGYRILGSARAQSPGWKTQGNKFLQLGDGKFGMGGISISTDRAGEWVTLDTPCASLDLQYMERPGGGGLRFTDNDGEPAEIPTGAAQIGPGAFHYNCSAGDHRFKITTEDSAPVTLFGWVATQPGVTWESIGINGAEAPLILKWDQQLFSQYLKDNSPGLIVLAYGTNEAASAHWDEENYRQAFASVVDTLHQYVPESSILVIGPSDRSVLRRHAWRAYDGTDRIVAAQRAVCRAEGCAYWDQRERMGGFGSMQQWASAGWAQPDHTHFSGEGYRALADAFMADLMASYLTYKEKHFPNTETAIQGATLGATNPNP
ncbi:MAG TPA: GDSL-type esterase/lipase family protein [Terracidiphilus sp.]|jgi:lysophospholipase L1-like esterase